MPLLPRRFERLKTVLNQRMSDLTVLVEHVEKPHNLSAILRSCDAVGVLEAHAVSLSGRPRTFNSTAQGSQRWVPLHDHADIGTAVEHLKAGGFRLYGTNLGVEARDYRDCDFTGPCAFVLGAEKWGLSAAATALMDQAVFIPMRGMVQSLNVSVATATLLFEALLERGGVDRYTMEQLAQGRGDLDGYLELFEPSQLTWPDTAAEVAGHLLRGGRAEQALTVLDHAAKASQIMEAESWHATRIAVLEALGRCEEAQQHRWQVFSKTLSIPVLREYLQRLDDFADVEAEEQALAAAEQHPLPLAALQFLVFWPSLPRAARYVIEHCHDWDGDAYEIVEPAAERLSADHPVAASLLLRSMVVFALSMGRSKRYRYAAENLRQCERLEARIDDWQGFESHNSFVGRLREAFAQKWSFWQLLER
ncbi:TrmH family RNA methyltransferase [Synechococcus sp. CBW1006]|uniref:TrmH family RNA methyltransferase n=1 Tax=Synechococcus sp. CBW1006 TaxID=1353138 RepID=UPI00351C0800